MKLLLGYKTDGGDVVCYYCCQESEMPERQRGVSFIDIDDADVWERCVSVKGGDLILADDPVRLSPQRIVIPESEILQAHGHYAENRRREYDAIPEQIDRITKALAHLAKQGIDIGDAGRLQVEHCAAVKASYPKKTIL